MTAKLLAAAAVLLCCVEAGWAQTATSLALPDDENGVATLTPSLTGTWKAPTEKLPLTGDFNEQVWGEGAQSVRDITLTVRDGGAATLTVTRKVVDKAGKVVPGSARTEVADLTIGAGEPGFATRIDHAVSVVKAERRYSDAPGDKWTLEKLRVSVVTFSDDRNMVELRFDPADGQGSFVEMLTRGSARRSSR